MEKIKLIEINTPYTAKCPCPDTKDTGICIEKHLDRVNNDIVVVEGDKVDYDKEIQSYKKYAGLETILKLQANMYGTLDNAIKKNAAKQVFLDVSKIPEDTQGKREYVAQLNEQLDKLAAKLGCSREEVLGLTEATFNKLMENKQGGNDDGKEDN